jgi:formylglycine-generating enzyme required for sulfatase activity
VPQADAFAEVTVHGRYAFLVSFLLASAVTARGEGDATLVARWTFDELRGTTARDSSGGGHDIDFADCKGLSWSRGALGGALAFARGARGPSMRIGKELLPAGRLWSVSVLIKTARPSGTVFLAGQPGSDRWAMRVQGGRAVFEVSMGRSSAWSVRSATSVADGKWHHLVGVRTAVKRIALYVDGALQQTLETQGGVSISTPKATFTLGSSAGTDPFVGHIDELTMYRRALTARNVQGLITSVRMKRSAAPGKGVGGVAPAPKPVSRSLTGPPSISEMLAVIEPSRTAAGIVAGTPLGEFEHLLATRGPAAARRHAEKAAARSDPADERLLAAARVAGLLMARDAAVREAASKTIGKRVILQLKRGKVRGKVKSVTDAGIILVSTFTVNRASRKTTRTVKWSDLAAGQTDKFAAGWKPVGVDGAIAAAYLALAAEDADAAEAAAAKAPGDHPLAAHVLGRAGVLRHGGIEAAALTAWKRAEKLFAAKDLKGAREAYKVFEREHGKTRTAAKQAALLKGRHDAIDRVLVPREITVDLGGGVTIEFVLVPAGEFSMGEEGVAEPVHGVKITRPFYLGKYEVTQAQYEKIMGSNPSEFKGVDLPVEQVSWSDTQKFMARANGMGILSGGRRHTFRLPTEAEWEYACRAGTTTDFNTGQGEGALMDTGWYAKNAGGKTYPVGKKAPNALGLHDMHGNVSEIVQDRFGRYSADPAVDPKGPSEGWNRVHRGGSCKTDQYRCRSASRGNGNPGHRSTDHGFRCVVEPAGQAVAVAATIHWLGTSGI